jgi:hypothetical protein
MAFMLDVCDEQRYLPSGFPITDDTGVLRVYKTSTQSRTARVSLSTPQGSRSVPRLFPWGSQC